jgi:selenide,water dikinase
MQLLAASFSFSPTTILLTACQAKSWKLRLPVSGGSACGSNTPSPVRTTAGFEDREDHRTLRTSKRSEYPKLALVQTVDFFTPLGRRSIHLRIAATNALRDIYAMGGRALTALALVCFPQQEDLDALEQIMQGGLSVMREAGCMVVGGHSVKDPEIKFGYAVSGLIDPRRIYTITGARRGDVLILTKPIGTGVITTAPR